MDIAAAKDIIAMYIDMENELQNEGYKERIKKAEKLNNELPDYQYDESGAIREWAMKEYQENNAHRHISHLYCDGRHIRHSIIISLPTPADRLY